jgi:ATP-dependent Zn protease
MLYTLHVLLCYTLGTGKTLLARVMAAEAGVPVSRVIYHSSSHMSYRVI